MLLNVSINTWNDGWKKVHEEKYLEFLAITGAVFPQVKPEKSSDWNFNKEFMADDEMVAALVRLGVSLEIKSAVGDCMLTKLQDKLRALGAKTDAMAEAIEKGCVVQIAIPDLGLMNIDEVTVLDDCCTNNLQTYLNQGWRLLAVCPPNAQRRPDYVMGRKRDRV